MLSVLREVYGSIFGHGASLGPDFAVDYRRRAALMVQGQNGGTASGKGKARMGLALS